MTLLSILFLGFGLSYANDLDDDLLWGVGIEDYVTINIYSDPEDVGLVCVAIEDWSVPADSELSCFDEEEVEFFGEVDLATLEWVGSASATHAYWHALSPDTVEIVLLAATGSVVGFDPLPEFLVDDIGECSRSPNWWRRLKRAAKKIRDRWKSRRTVRRVPRTPPQVQPPPVPTPMYRGPGDNLITFEEWSQLGNRFTAIKDHKGNIVGHYDLFGNFWPASGTYRGGRL